MKTLAIIFSLIFSLAVQAQTGTPIFKIGADGSIETNSSMIDPFYDAPRIKDLPCALAGSTSVSVGAQTFDVKTGYFEEMDETERGKYGFTVIAIYSGDQKIFELKESELWTYTYDGKSTMDYRQYTDNRYFIPITLSDDAVALAFIGWPYGGDMPYLTIIALTKNDAKLVFNKHMGINAITRSDRSYCMELQANIVEYDENARPFNDPILHGIVLKDGLLYFN